MAENQILPFAYADGANVLSQSDYQADNQRLIGHQPGIARSALENKALRQASAMAAGQAQFIADGQANDVTDAKTPAEIAAMLGAAIGAKIDGSFEVGENYFVFPRGLIVQWGSVQYSASPGSVLQAAFPVAFNGTRITTVASTSASGFANIYPVTNAVFAFSASASDTTVFWVAIGY